MPNDPRVYFGLGKAARVDKVQVTWTDFNLETFGTFEADRIVELRRARGLAR